MPLSFHVPVHKVDVQSGVISIRKEDMIELGRVIEIAIAKAMVSNHRDYRSALQQLQY
jgi:hypothetical protein